MFLEMSEFGEHAYPDPEVTDMLIKINGGVTDLLERSKTSKERFRCHHKVVIICLILMVILLFLQLYLYINNSQTLSLIPEFFMGGNTTQEG